MERGVNLSTLQQRQAEWDQHKSDVLIRLDQLKISEPPVADIEPGMKFRLGSRGVSSIQTNLGHAFSEHALSQFCSTHTFDRKRWESIEGSSLLSVRDSWRNHVNSCMQSGFGLKGSNPEKLVRVYTPDSAQDSTGPIVRAILSDKYTPFSTATLLEKTVAALDVLDQKGISFTVWQCSQKLDNIWLRLVSTRRTDHGGGGDLIVGVNIGNSENGTQALTVEGFVADSKCWNGLIFGQRMEDRQQDGVMYRRHIGSVVILQHRFNLALADAFLMADTMMEKFLGLHDVNVQDPLDEIVKIVSKRSTRPGFTDTLATAAKALLPSYTMDHGNTMFSVVSALTQAAQAASDNDRVSIEREMGAMVATATQ